MTAIPLHAAPTWLDAQFLCIRLDNQTIRLPLTQLHKLPDLLRGLAVDCGVLKESPRNLTRERQLAQIEDHIAARQTIDLHELGLL